MAEDMLLPKSVATRGEKGCGENRIAVARGSKHAHAPSHLLINPNCAIGSGAGGVLTITMVRNCDDCQAHGQPEQGVHGGHVWCSAFPDTVKGRRGCFACQLWLASQRALLVYNRTLQHIVQWI